jgi:hypothetical protein
MSDSERLTNPPNGGKLRQWEAIGMSRASWYRHGKPTEKPGALGEWFRRKELEHWKSKRTVERVKRIMEFDGDLWNLMVDGHFKPAQAERIICDPVEYHGLHPVWMTRG